MGLGPVASSLVHLSCCSKAGKQGHAELFGKPMVSPENLLELTLNLLSFLEKPAVCLRPHSVPVSGF